MREPQLNRISSKILIVLSLVALLAVISGYFQPPQPDEGAAAHIFQLSVAAIFATVIAFLVTADWREPARTVRPLALPAGTLAIAFAALFYLEHYR